MIRHMIKHVIEKIIAIIYFKIIKIAYLSSIFSLNLGLNCFCFRYNFRQFATER